MLRQRTTLAIFLLLVVGCFAVGGSTSHAASSALTFENPVSDTLGNSDLRTIIVTVIKWALGLLTLVAVSYMIYGGFVWMTAAGNAQRVEKAKQIILQAAIGLVIVLLAWAIVLFVAKSVTNSTATNGGGGPGPGCGLNCPPSALNTFDITAVSSCAVAPDFSKDVPLSSAISFTFNSDLETAAVQAAVVAGKLKIQKCSSSAAGYNCGTWVDTPTTPKETEPQSFTAGPNPIGAAGATKAEWVVNKNSLTFYHLSFSTDPTNADNRWFEAQSSPPPKVAYHISIPRQDDTLGAPVNPDALIDKKLPQARRLVHCQRPGPRPIIGDSIIGEHCKETGNEITWDFTSGTDTVGQPLIVRGTTPSSDYLASPTTMSPARNVPRNPTLGVDFNGGLDPASAVMANFEVTKFTVPPTQAGGWTNGTVGAPLPASDFEIRTNGTGTGVWVQLKQTASCNASSQCSAGSRQGQSCVADVDCPQMRQLDSFTWYKLTAKNFRNLCGSVMQPAQRSWVFETNDVTPGVAQVYPANGFLNACPTTRVFVQFKTSMWDITADPSECTFHGASNYNLQTELDNSSGVEVTSRTWNLMDPVPPLDPDPNAYCKHFEFLPPTAGLPTGAYHGGITTTMPYNSAGSNLTFGDQPPLTAAPTDGKGWGFSVKPPGQCYQPPVVTRVDPGHDINGACISVFGDYFTDPANPPPGTTYPRAADVLTLGLQPQPVPPTAWQTNSIVSTVSNTGLTAGNNYDYQVKVNYAAPIGPLTSATSVNSKFTLDTGTTTSTRPCLFSVNPSQGLPSQTGITASGKDFGTKTGPATFTSDNPGPWASGAWTTSSISGITVAAGAIPNQNTNVWVVDSNNQASNKLPFTVKAPVVIPPGGPGTPPAVIDSATCNQGSGQYPSPNPYKTDTNACINTVVTIHFTLPLDASTVTSSTAKLCTDALCASPVATTVSAVGTVVTLTPSSNLSPSTVYHVLLTTGIKGRPAPPGGPGTGPAMAADYAYQFTTKSGTDACVLTALGLSPNGTQTTNNKNYPAIGLTGLPMDALCHVLNLPNQQYTWTQTNTAVGTLSPPQLVNTSDSKKFLNSPAAGAAVGSTDIQVGTQTLVSPKFTLTYSPLACTTSSQCVTNGLGMSCGTPACVNGKCQPVVIKVDPNNGPVGSWPTIFGCWLDNTPGTVTFFDSKDGLVPDPALCGNGTWTNDYVIREVPPGAAGGNHSVALKRNDNVVATYYPNNNAGDYNVTTAPLGTLLCKVSPNFGKNNDPTTLSGHGFGATQQASDKVTFEAIATLTPSSWAATVIGVNVPSLSPVGTNLVRVVKGAQTSNPVPYNVQAPSACAVACIFGPSGDTYCNSQNAGTACGYSGCCAAQPKIIPPNSPPNNTTNVCRNAVTTVNFDQPLDKSTVASSTVRYYDNNLQRNGTIQVTNTTSTSTISYYPGVLSAGKPQRLELTKETAVNLTFPNQSFDEKDPVTGNTPRYWNAITVTTKQSPDAHSGPFSALVDCRSLATCPTQAFIAQDIPTATVPINSTATYRISGYVKVIAASNFAPAGFLAQCGPPGSVAGCGYSNSGVVFNSPNTSWQYISFLATRNSGPQQPLRITCYANAGTAGNPAGAAILCDDIKLEEVTFSPTTGIRSSLGALANVTGSPVTFTTGNDMCAVDQVTVIPSSQSYTAKGQVAGFTAYPLNRGVVISQVPGTITWDWSWLSGNAAVATVASVSASGVDPNQANGTAVGNGRTTIKAQAKITADSSTPSTKDHVYSDYSDINVAFCTNPWKLDPTTPALPIGFTDSAGNCDTFNGNCPSFNFDLQYCRDSSQGLLPNFNYIGSGNALMGSIEGLSAGAPDQTRLKSYFFKETKASRDTIGLLIFKNDEFLSPYDWFKKRFPLDTSAASTTVAGYPAVKTGTTTYIGVTDLEGGVLKGLMFVFDYNSNNASPETVTIASKILDSLTFNTNLSASDKSKLVRDTKRLQDLRSIKNSLEDYKTKNSAYPALASGSFIPGFTTSAWPSWQATLGQAMSKTLPTDPANTFAVPCSGQYESSSCWSESLKNFSCTGDASIYAVRSTGATVDLYGSMEYTGTGKLQSSPRPSGVCPSLGPCNCFNYKLP